MDNQELGKTLATAVIQQAKENTEKWFRAFVVASAIAVISIVALTGVTIYLTYVMNSYEIVYQDGNGQNNYNNNVEGDVDNVSTDKAEEVR